MRNNTTCKIKRCRRKVLSEGVCRGHFWDPNKTPSRSRNEQEYYNNLSAYDKKHKNLISCYKISLKTYEKILFENQQGECPLCSQKADTINNMLTGKFWPGGSRS